MRAFIGLPVPSGWVAPLMRAQALLPGGRQVDADDLHITLAFLDDQPEATLEALHGTLTIRALPTATVAPLAYSVLGGRDLRAAVLDLTATPDLTQLRDSVRGAARLAGLSLPRERFRPHVTLTRYSRSRPADRSRMTRVLTQLTTEGLPPTPAGALTLWSSTLTPDGPIYDPLATYPMRAA